jgi:hypothetical protein
MAKTIVTLGVPIESALTEHPEHVHAIGMISIEIANIENSLANLLAALLGITGRQAHLVYFTPKAAIARVDVVANVADALGEEHKEVKQTVAALLGRVRKLFGKRHDYVHNAWGFSQEHNEVVRSPLPSKKRFDQTIVPLSELRDMIDRIRELNMKIWNEQFAVAQGLRPEDGEVLMLEIGGKAQRRSKATADRE